MINKLKSFFGQQPPHPTLTVEQIQRITRILVIDDDFPDLPLVDHLKKEKWHVDAIDDLESFTNAKFQKAHIICLDIMGVGKKLKVENGMYLVKEIKVRFPEKKILLYSSVSQQDIFDEAVDLVDKRLRKTSSCMPFSSAVEDLAKKTLNWEDAILYAFEKTKKYFPNTLTVEEFRKSVDKSFIKSNFDVSKFISLVKVPMEAANLIAALVKFTIQ
jgi:hypothetical protein